MIARVPTATFFDARGVETAMTVDQRAGAQVLLALVLVTSGCIGFLTGDEPLAFEASSVSVTQDALDETGYETGTTREVALNRSFEVAGQRREVAVTNHVAEYQRTVSVLGFERKAAVFVVLSTPQVRILDRTFNPVGDMTNRELLQQLQSRYSQVEVGANVGSTSVSTLGQSAVVDKFEGRASLGGTQIDVFIHVTKIEHDGDFIVAVGVYPQVLPNEDRNVLILVRNIAHGG